MASVVIIVVVVAIVDIVIAADVTLAVVVCVVVVQSRHRGQRLGEARCAAFRDRKIGWPRHGGPRSQQTQRRKTVETVGDYPDSPT